MNTPSLSKIAQRAKNRDEMKKSIKNFLDSGGIFLVGGAIGIMIMLALILVSLNNINEQAGVKESSVITDKSASSESAKRAPDEL